MDYKATVVAKSYSPVSGTTLTTMLLTYPHIVHAHLLTHRMFSRSSASSRAIPYAKMRGMVGTYPVLPIYWGANQAGIQAQGELPAATEDFFYEDASGYLTREAAQGIWSDACSHAMSQADLLHHGGKGMHKQILNRLVEPFSWITVLVTATDWDGFFWQRCHSDAQPEIRRIAELAYEAMQQSEAQTLGPGQWHLPLYGDAFDDDPRDLLTLVELPAVAGAAPRQISRAALISIGRCARTSYLTHDGRRDVEADIRLAIDRLLHPDTPDEPVHWSPWEHVALPMEEREWDMRKDAFDIACLSKQHCGAFDLPNEVFEQMFYSGNLRGFHAARKLFPLESGRGLTPR